MNYVFHLGLPSISTSQGPEGKLIIFLIFRKKTVKLQIVGKQLKQSTELMHVIRTRAHSHILLNSKKCSHFFVFVYHLKSLLRKNRLYSVT